MNDKEEQLLEAAREFLKKYVEKGCFQGLPPVDLQIAVSRYDRREMTDAELLEEQGWTIDCQSPFEISHRDGSSATGSAANMVVDALRAEYTLQGKRQIIQTCLLTWCVVNIVVSATFLTLSLKAGWHPLSAIPNAIGAILLIVWALRLRGGK